MDNNQLVKEFYETKDNYKVIDIPDAAEPDLAVIYFSSVGLYSDKNCQKRLNEDYYEFHRNRVKRAGRHIYVRDVTISVYLDGISRKVNSIEKVFELLKKLTEGRRVITLGVSGGGYMAMLARHYMNIEYAVSVSGVAHLDHIYSYFEELPDWLSWNAPEKKKFFNIVEMIKDCPGDIYQFEAYKCIDDYNNAQIMKPLKHLKAIYVDSDAHGGEVDPPALGRIINFSHAELDAFFDRWQGRQATKTQLNWDVLSLMDLAKFYGKKLRKNFFKIKISKKEKLLTILGISLINTTGNRYQD